MIHTVGAYRLGFVGVLALALVGAPPAPNTGGVTFKPTPTPTPDVRVTGPTRRTPTPTPTPILERTPTPTPTPTPHSDKLKLSDTIRFDGPQFCQLTSDVDEREKPPEKPGPQRCRMTPGPVRGSIQVTVPGDPSETIYFTYFVSKTGVLTGTGKEVETPGAPPYPATVTGQVHGLPGTATGAGVIQVWEAANAP